jgi:hypothetical protein
MIFLAKEKNMPLSLSKGIREMNVRNPKFSEISEKSFSGCSQKVNRI